LVIVQEFRHIIYGIPETKRILMSRNVIFNEVVMFTDSQTSADSDVSYVSDDEQ
jgi:hypothetical protein